MASKEQLIEVVNILGNVVRNIHLKRVLSDIDNDPPLNFWRVIYGDLLDISVLEWCKLFGSDDEEHQKTHWKNVVGREEEDGFREHLFRQLGVEAKAWISYWNEMKKYRDQYVAHRDFCRTDITNYPTLDIALESSHIYYGYVIGELRKQGVTRYPNDLGEYGIAFASQAKNIGEIALRATKHLEERVS